MPQLHIHEDIRQATTLPGWFYQRTDVFEDVKEKIFASTWQYATDTTDLAQPLDVFPFTLLPGILDEPLLFTKDKNEQIHCLSNVCTHRAKILIEKPANSRMLSCGYHGRCFRHDGTFKSMPAFEGVANFPAASDHLTKVPFTQWLGMLFTSLNPKVSLSEMTQPIRERLSWLPLDTLTFAPQNSQDYIIEANWALYCDNYLEGLHIPFVHPSLHEALDFGEYAYELFPYCNLQIGIAKEGEPCFDIPTHAPDHGRNIYAYYFWVFPNMMFNIYPWGLSFNAVQPLSQTRTRIHYRTYYFSGIEFNREVNRIDETETEDDAVVESAQLGVRSRFYQHGRYSAQQEPCVHHFHRLVAQFLAG